MTSRFRRALIVAAGIGLLAGCDNAGPITYSRNEKLSTELKGKPKLQAAVVKALDDLFGPTPQRIIVPPGLGLPANGRHLANLFVDVSRRNARPKPQYYENAKGEPVFIEGGYALYRRHCLHCHGVTGDGAGPTSAFLWPRPRDFRPGKFKFTSSTSPDKPTRSDLRKTVLQGIANSAMPSFESLMSSQEIEQVLDYVIFLSSRGQSEIALINAASQAEDNEADTFFNKDTIQESIQPVFDAWHDAEANVLNPPLPRTPSSSQSIASGREFFLGKKGTQCFGCHGVRADGNGKSFVNVAVFNYVTFGGDPDRMAERLAVYTDPKSPHFDANVEKIWKDGSLDDWGNPLRPADLNQGMYKGGRRPIDLYWRIAKGINGAKMPAHASILTPQEIWDTVNFVLALPYDRDLLKDAKEPAAAPTTAPAATPKVARR